jgi:hypothetical protein
VIHPCALVSPAAVASALGLVSVTLVGDPLLSNGSAANRAGTCAYRSGPLVVLRYTVASAHQSAVVDAAGAAAVPLPANAPASARFSPGLGAGSTGTLIAGTGTATASVSATRGGRMVTVTSSAPTATAARRAAVAVAAALLSAPAR